MGLLTIGAFARAAGLTPKALRLYDDLGLLTPAAVDGESGYRYYDPGQLAAASLISRLRGIGMPLADIREVRDLSPQDAAAAVAAFWRRVSAGNAETARLAALLVEDLSGRKTMTNRTLSVRYAAAAETGPQRTENEDSAFASDRLFAVADGLRGPAGAEASAAAIGALKPLSGPPAALLGHLAEAVGATDRIFHEKGVVSTLTALVLSGDRIALVHVGDTRAYLLRDGDLLPLTTDHTLVQAQLDQGKIGPGDVAGHPQRALLTRALGTGNAEADLAIRTALAGDRYFLCSDGVHTVVPRDTLIGVLNSQINPDEAVRTVMEHAEAAGAPDNIACVVADLS